MDEKFLANIERDGVILRGESREKYAKLQNAVLRLREALAEYAAAPTSTVRDGATRRFGLCTELAWKTLQGSLLDQGYTGRAAPAAALQKLPAAFYTAGRSFPVRRSLRRRWHTRPMRPGPTVRRCIR